MHLPEIPDTPLIYAIRNTVSGKVYVGKSCRPIKRVRCHLSELRLGKHHCRHLQHSWDKHGPDAFVFEIVELCPGADEQTLVRREQYWTDRYQAFDRAKGFNSGACAAVWNRGRKATPEERATLSRACLKAMTPERLHFLRTVGVGRRWTAEQRVKLSQPRGNVHTLKSKRALSIAQSRHQASLTERERRGVHAHRMTTARLVDPYKRVYEVRGMRGFCAEFRLDRAAIGRVLKGTNRSHKGWTRFDGDASTTTFIIKTYS